MPDLLEKPSGRVGLNWLAHARVDKWHSDFDYESGIPPYETVEVDGNLLTTAGAQRLEDLLIGAGGQAFNNANSRIGVGNSATAANAADTDLGAAAGSTNRQFVTMDATFPSRSGTTVTFRSTFTSALGNFAWAEWGIDNGTANATTVTAVFLNHKIASLGTKVSGASWQFTVTVVVS